MTSSVPPSAHKTASSGMFRTMLTTWTRRDWLQAAGLLGFIAFMHVVAFAVLLGVVGPAHYHVGTQAFGIGLGVTAYTFGLRHAFDADHIAAIDNTTRKLMADGNKPKSVGFWFAMGHSSMVLVMAVLVVAGDSRGEFPSQRRLPGQARAGTGGDPGVRWISVADRDHQSRCPERYLAGVHRAAQGSIRERELEARARQPRVPGPDAAPPS